VRLEGLGKLKEIHSPYRVSNPRIGVGYLIRSVVWPISQWIRVHKYYKTRTLLKAYARLGNVPFVLSLVPESSDKADIKY
jgi:hypothetical protein